MKTKRIAFGFLIIGLMACNFATQLILPPTPTPTATVTASATSTITPSPTATPLVPAYIPPQCEGRAFPTLSPEEALTRPTPEYPLNKNISKRVQLRVFQDVVSLIEEVYVYPDYNGRDWNEIKGRYRAKIEAGLDTEVFYFEMQAMVDELGDEHSAYLSPIEAGNTEDELHGEFQYVGVGLSSDYDFDKQKITIIAVYPDSPAEHSGLQSHDSILLVDGLPITEGIGDRLRGPECSPVVMEVQSPGEPPRQVMLIRSVVDGSLPLETRLVETNDGSKVGYILLPSFYDDSLPQQMEAALNQFGTLDGLILDLRTNGGGSSVVAYPIMSLFTQGRLGEFVGRKSSTPLEIRAHEIQNSQTVPLIILVGRYTVSFGEIFAGIMQDSGRAKVVGETSLGNVEVLNGYDFDDGSLIWIASQRFVSAFSNADWETTGIIPDVEAYADWDTFYFEIDPAIDVSLRLLGHK